MPARAEPDLPILLLNGFMTREELRECLARRIETVVHADYQLPILDQVLAEEALSGSRKLWVKYNTGMNRLGLGQEQAIEAYLKLRAYPGTQLVLMSHLACADAPNTPEFAQFTEDQRTHGWLRRKASCSVKFSRLSKPVWRLQRASCSGPRPISITCVRV